MRRLAGRGRYHNAVGYAQSAKDGSGGRTGGRWWDLTTWDRTTRSVGVAWVCVTILAFYVPYARHEGLPLPDGPEWLPKFALQVATVLLGMRLTTLSPNRAADTRADATSAYEIVPR